MAIGIRARDSRYGSSRPQDISASGKRALTPASAPVRNHPSGPAEVVVHTSATSPSGHTTAATASISTFEARMMRSEEHTSELQSRGHLVCRLLLEKKKTS